MFKNIKNEKINFLILSILVFITILVLFGGINIYKSSEIINDQTNANFLHVAEDIRESSSIASSISEIKDSICKHNLCKTEQICLLDKDDKIIFFKDYKSSTGAEVIDKTFYDFLAGNEVDSEVKLQDGEAKLVLSSSHKKLFAITKLYNGFTLVLETSAKELYAETNKFVTFVLYSLILVILFGLLIAIESYYKIKKINDELMHKEKLISMGKLSAEIAHEINNPLSYISCNIDTLKIFVDKMRTFMLFGKNELDKVLAHENSLESAIECIENIKSEFKISYVLDSLDELIDESKDGIKRVSEIVISLKNFAKNDSLDSKTNEYLEKIIEGALITLGNKMPTGVEVIKNFKDIPPLLCNKNQMSQVLINLIDNACFSVEKNNRKDKKIIISTYKKLNNAYIEIEDNGIGIEKNKLNKIFDSFFTTKANEHGTGLGLSISKEIITKKHNGEIFVESKIGKGTKFTVKIPY